MKAGVLTGPGKIEIKELPVPEAGGGLFRTRFLCASGCGGEMCIARFRTGWSIKNINFIKEGINNVRKF